jgi:RNA-directed DNA polymerase
MDLIPPFPVEQYRDSIVSDLSSDGDSEALFEALIGRGLPPLVDTRVLSLILGMSHKLLWAMATVPNRYYRQFEIPKRSGGRREIATPRVFLKVVQRWVLMNILYRRELPLVVTGFAPGRGLMTNASFHVGRKYLTKVDIQDFFPSIGFQQVRRVYHSFGFPDKVVLLLSRLSLLKGVLPQGAPTSPQLANLVFLPCDAEIIALCERAGVSYSRYADDLTFSSDRPISVSFVGQVIRLIQGHSFNVNPDKFRFLGPGQRLSTTGMVVNAVAHPERVLRRQLRARFHQAERDPGRFTLEANRLMGWAAYVNMYDPVLGRRYLAIASRVRNSPTSLR